MAYSQYSGFIPRCQHIKTNGTQCGSPALHRRRFCFFHNRWRATRLDLNRAGALHVISTVELPVLEDADSIQVALMQVLRLILCRQLDGKTGGLMLYGLQIASSNLPRVDFEHRYKSEVIIDPRNASATGVGDDAWDPEDFEDEDEEPADDEEDQNSEAANAHVAAGPSVARAPSPATADTLSKLEFSSHNVSHATHAPAIPAENQAAKSAPSEAAKRRKKAAHGPSRGTQTEIDQAPEGRKKPCTRESDNQSDEAKNLQRVQAALKAAEKGSWRDLKTVFEFAGIYPKTGANSTGDDNA